jgi:predicted dehydrogenase
MVAVLNSVPSLKVRAICDIDSQRLAALGKELGVDETYRDYEEMLEQSDLDAVFIATPMDLHVPQSIAALRKGLHVLCEVTAAVSIDQCRQLVAACKAGSAVYMMAENYNYNRPVAAVRQMVLKGLFGKTYYGEGGYVADLKELALVTPWRRRWQLGVNGITYVTHNLGPILQWMPGQRVVSVCCSGSGHNYRDPRGAAYEAEDNCTMLCKTGGGGQIVIRSDFLSNRPGLGVYYGLQGTEGCYESPRCPGDTHRVWLKSASAKPQWMNLADIEEQYLPDYWKEAIARGLKVGGEYFQCVDFVRAIQGKARLPETSGGQAPNPVGIHETMDLTLPGLISQLSASDGGRWMDVPDSRDW